MRTLKEIEEFLEANCTEFKAEWDRETKIAWMIENAHYLKRTVFKMRNAGQKSWNNFLWAYGLEESLTLTRL